MGLEIALTMHFGIQINHDYKACLLLYVTKVCWNYDYEFHITDKKWKMRKT